MIASKYTATIKLTAALLILVIAQVYVLAHPSAVVFGKLSTSGDNIVLVNGNGANSGATILSGSQLQTPENTTASVQLDSLGTLTLAPNTNLSLSFSAGHVEVNVASGRAQLTTAKGVDGAMTFKGKTERTDPSLDSSTVNAGDPLPQGGTAGAFGPSFWHVFWFGLIIIGGSIFLAVFVPCRRPRNPSPGAPDFGQCRRGF